MNVLFHTNQVRRARHVFLWSFALLIAFASHAQGTHKPLVSLKNGNVKDTISGVNLTVYVSSPVAKHGNVTKTQIFSGGGSVPHVYEVTYTPDPNFIGLDTFVVELNYNGQTPFLHYRAYAVTVLPSLLRVNTDFIITQINTPVSIPVTANDFSSTGVLNVTGIPSVEYGTGSVIGGGTVLFSPQIGFSGIAHLNYTVCDQLDHCKTGSVNISVQNGQPAQTDTLYLTTVKNTKVDHVLNFEGYQVYIAPDSGAVTLSSGFSLSYVPKLGFSGAEAFTLVNNNFGAPRYLHIITSVINTPSQNFMAMDDYVYTPKNQPITFNVRTNDVGNLNVTGWVAPLASQGTIGGTNSNGTVTFTPSANFKGVATFRYRIGSLWNNNVETATAHVVVGDLAPTQSTYVLATPAETPLVINYQLPFIGYDFAVIQAPVNGTTAFYPGQSSFSFGTQSVTGNNLLVYTPSAGYTGPDEMVVNYCITGTNSCHTVKVEINVNEVISTAGPYCLDNCVWVGDVNHDGVVNNKDILPLGYFMGTSGEDRPNATFEWYGQYADDWNNPFVSLPFDLKHADTDGNGLISLSDTSAIHQLYGNTHALVPAIPPTGKGLPFDFHLLTPNPQVGDLVQVEVQLGKTTDPALNIFGFTLDVSLSQNVVDSLFAMQYYPNTWLNNNAASLSFSKRPRQGRLESAFTRIGNTPVSGMNTRIGRYEFIIIEVVDDIKGDVVPMLSMQIDGGQVMHTDGSMGYVEPYTIDVPVHKSGERSSATLVSDAELFAYPSPAQESINVHLNGDHVIEEVTIYNLAGQVVQQVNGLAVERTTLSTETLTDGVYFLKALTTGGPIAKKFVVKH
jgi:hypothetical protein